MEVGRLGDESVEVSCNSREFAKIRDVIYLVTRGVPVNRLEKYLTAEEYYLSFDLRDLTHTRSVAERIIGRILGRNGSMKKTIEELTDASIYVKGSVVTVLGEYSAVSEAKAVIDDLVAGKPHKVAILNSERRIAQGLGLKKW
ncbi:MAG: KH domain-containing protein [Candidatus Marsarchaeota archaeon]|nr:KH domain-containing protein [Candidatus Marsarchaeota archaeon]